MYNFTMKVFFIMALASLANAATRQDDKKDITQVYDYGARIFDPRIRTYVNVDSMTTKQNASYQATVQDTTAEEYCNIGEEYMKQKNFDAALNSFNNAIKLKPIAKYYTKRAVCLMFQGKVKEAHNDFDTAIKIDPKYAEAYLFKGSIFQFGGDNKTAKKYYTKAIEVNPKYADAYMMRGLLEKDTNKKKLCKDLKKAAELGSKKAISAYQELCECTGVLKL